MTATQQLRQRVQDLQDYIAQGRVMEAMDEFYAEEVSMQENLDAPTVGRAANIEREKEFLANVKEWKRFEVKSIGIDGDIALVESISEFVTQDGTNVHSEQVSRSVWNDGKIVDERFYHQGYGD